MDTKFLTHKSVLSNFSGLFRSFLLGSISSIVRDKPRLFNLLKIKYMTSFADKSSRFLFV
ncbi:hypothetical protein F950_02454 [Acinetobacter soli NIPH 2899]|uniref:Uncharacterized protein n=1 Tax=Acinetobacter soli NIPH 2899 TaxID=1217677 RepID=A0ABN0JWE6_9GAMM|nr:hypothetical protein F950_02454 [Acinetobacter soli NIPH 2899]